MKGLFLRLFIHGAAFRAGPVAYLRAFWWRLSGKRLRSRYQFARLLGGSPRAYDLWKLWYEETLPSSIVSDGKDAEPQILAFIDIAASEQGGVEKTLLSLSAEGISALIVPQDQTALTDVAGQIDKEAYFWLMPLAAGDTLAPGAVSAYRAALSATSARVVYADDDLLDEANHRSSPHFKPDWNSELFGHFDYLTGACILQTSRKELAHHSYTPDWAQQLVLKRVRGTQPFHVRKILHHRRFRPVPLEPKVSACSGGNLPLVSIIVPTRNRVDLLRTCLEGIATTHYPNLEVIIVDNDSDDPATLDYLASLEATRFRILRHAGEFNFSAINNRAARVARGELLCLLNNDIEVIEPNWLSIMVTQAVREEVGAVGARLLYPDGRIQHAGVVIGMGNAAGHAHRFLHTGDLGYFKRHGLPQFTSAVTAACLVVARERFFKIGGFDERNFAVAFNDVDLCLRLNQRGWQALYEPRATLVHHESVSRGLDRDPVGAARFARELAALQRLWGTDTIVDPYHHPELSRASEQFVVRL